MSRTLICKNHFDGDTHTIKLINTFCAELLDLIKDEGLAGWANHNAVLETFQEQIYKNTDKYQFFLVMKPFNDAEKMEAHFKKVSMFLENFLEEHCDMRVLFDHFYETEWKKWDHENNTQIAQFNGMKVAYNLKVMFKNVVRNYIYNIYSDCKAAVMREKGIDCYMTSKGEISKYISDPEPQYAGAEEKGKHHEEKSRYRPNLTKEQEWEHEISLRANRILTTQPDIRVLKPFLEEHLEIKFIDDPENEGEMMSRYRCFDNSRQMQMINELKYKHLNIGQARTRRIMNLGKGNMEHRVTGDISDREVTGKKWW